MRKGSLSARASCGRSRPYNWSCSVLVALNEIERQRRAEQRLRQLDEKQRAAAER